MISKYLGYFKSTWLGKTNKRTELWGKPKFSFGLWNKYSEIKDGQADLTSNRSEAYNSAVKISLLMKPNLWVICKTVTEEEGIAMGVFLAGILEMQEMIPTTKKPR